MAQILTSLSGLQFSAAAAPTNSADVSAIASAYQVVSSTATQLYAGTAYVTSVNGNQLSASRAGNAANASLANSAWYDGTGRLISALPDSAAVSAIVSSYVESGVSGKQDTLSFAYNTADQISSINGSALGGMDEAAVSGIASAYAESAASSKVDLYNVNDVNITAKGLAISGASGVTARYGDKMAVLQTYPLQRMYLYDQGTNKGVYTYPSGISGNGDGNWQYGTSEYGKLTSVYDTVSGNSATWGVAGVDSATCSAIASSYAESAASSKADESSLSGYYTTANESGFITGVDLTDYATTAYVDSAVSSKADSSALSSYVPYSSLEYNTASAISGINGSALAAGSTYSAGEGIDITDDVISVETPVDIVAGPGIVIDNPDGNTLRVSVAQAEEVVLYDAGGSPSQAGPWQISEARTNFEWVDIVFGNDTTGSMKQVTRFAADSEYMKLHLPRYDEEPSYKWSTMTLSWNNTTASIKTNSVGRFTIASNGAVSVSTAAAQAPYLFQIIGVHRINGGN